MDRIILKNSKYNCDQRRMMKYIVARGVDTTPESVVGEVFLEEVMFEPRLKKDEKKPDLVKLWGKRTRKRK